MQLVLTLLVRDEADVIAATIEHHVAAGVDHIIATDNGSVDGTRDILAAYEKTGRLTIIDEPDHTYEQAKWVTRMARQAANNHGADWIINADADEFFTPLAYPSLKTALTIIPEQYGTIHAARENLLGDPRLPADTPWPARLTVRDLLSLHEKGGRIGGKIIHRAAADINVAQGNHAIEGAVGKRWPAAPITIFHVPDRSYAQFENKIRVGGASLAANESLAKSSGWHWRADYERLQAGTLRATWQERQLAPAALTAGLRDGSLVDDVWLRDRLLDVFSVALRPDLLAPVLTRP